MSKFNNNNTISFISLSGRTLHQAAKDDGANARKSNMFKRYFLNMGAEIFETSLHHFC